MYTSVGNIMMLALRIFLSYSLAKKLGSDVIAVSESSSWVLGVIIFYLRYKSNRWMTPVPKLSKHEG